MPEKLIEIRDLLRFRYPENLQYSPDGTVLAFQCARPDEEKNTYHRDVWIIRNGKAKQLTASLSTSIVFWDDDTHLVVRRQIPGEKISGTDLYRIDICGGEAQKWLSLPLAVNAMKKVSDGLYAVSAAIDRDGPDAYRDPEDVRKKKQEEREKSSFVQVVDEIPFWFNGAGFINGKRTALFVVRTGEKTQIRRITSPSFAMEEFVVDGTMILYSGNTRRRSHTLYSKIYAYDTVTGTKRILYGKNTHSIQRLFVLNGQLYAQASDMKEYGGNETGNICKVTENGLEFVLDPQRSLYCASAGDTMLGGGKQFAVSGDAFYTLATDDDHTAIWKYNADWQKTVLFDGPGAVFFLDVCGDRIAFARETPSSLGEIWEMGTDGSAPLQITALNTEVLKDTCIALPQRLDYVSTGEQLHGWVLLPPEYKKKKNVPAVLDIHGGPRAVYGEHYFHEMQVWAARGYAVLFTNIRGSDGRDDAFADIRDQYGYVDYQNLMDFTDAVLDAYPKIDRDRLCVTGGSYGGFMTNWIITQTDRFCCAASQRSIANWVSMCFISDIGSVFACDQCGTDTPFGDAGTRKLWEHSPLRYAQNAKTPTLFIHSDEDYRCPLPEGIQMMQALAVRNIETRLVIFHGENHDLSRGGKPAGRIRRLEEITGWFEKHTK